LCTGISSRRAAASLALLVALLAPGSGRAQSFKLSSLRIPSDVPAGSWVAYQVDVVSKNRPPRKITQRIAVVSREGTGSEAGAWVELKTSEAGRTRIERGFFMRSEKKRGSLLDSLYADEGPPEPDSSGAQTKAPPLQRLRLARYQKLTPDGKLYEYPMDEEGAASLPEEEVSAMDMFEFAGRGRTDSLPPDTLRVGRRVVPCRVRRVQRQGSQGWEGDDSTYTNRALMTTTFWRNPWIPVTGTARKIIEVSSERVRVAGSATDSAATATEPATGTSPGSDFFYRATVALIDLGADAVPEITQSAEPAPRESTPRPRSLDR